jgi:hypothetical protein
VAAIDTTSIAMLIVIASWIPRVVGQWMSRRSTPERLDEAAEPPRATASSARA